MEIPAGYSFFCCCFCFVFLITLYGPHAEHFAYLKRWTRMNTGGFFFWHHNIKEVSKRSTWKKLIHVFLQRFENNRQERNHNGFLVAIWGFNSYICGSSQKYWTHTPSQLKEKVCNFSIAFPSSASLSFPIPLLSRRSPLSSPLCLSSSISSAPIWAQVNVSVCMMARPGTGGHGETLMCLCTAETWQWMHLINPNNYRVLF